MGAIVDYSIRFNFDAVREELERALSPSFGLLPDRLMMFCLMQNRSSDHRLLSAKPPAHLQWLGWQAVFQYQWYRLVELVRDPVKVHKTSQGLTAVQVLGLFIYVYLPNGVVSAYKWVRLPEGGMGLREEVRGSAPLTGAFFRTEWLQHIAELATFEVENDCLDTSERVQRYTEWQFQQFAACLPSHVNKDEFQTRLECLLPLEPQVLEIAQRLFAPFGYQGTVTVQQYNLVVRRQRELTALEVESPTLLSLYALCCTDGQFPKSGEPVQNLRTYLLSRGLSSRGWRMVLAMNPKCLNFIREFYQGSTREAALDYLRICEALGVESHQPRWLMACMLSMFGNSARPKRSYFKSMLADHFMENAAHIMRLYLNGSLPIQPKQSVLVVDVMRWLARDNATQFTRAQRQRGWDLLTQKARDWHVKLEVSASRRFMHWETPFDSIDVDGYRLVCLSDTRQLFDESKAMYNCVDGHSYASRCIDGSSCLASLRLAGKQAATIEFTRAPSGDWILKAALGPCNKPLPQLLIRKLERLGTGIGELTAAKMRNKAVSVDGHTEPCFEPAVHH